MNDLWGSRTMASYQQGDAHVLSFQKVMCFSSQENVKRETERRRLRSNTLQVITSVASWTLIFSDCIKAITISSDCTYRWRRKALFRWFSFPHIHVSRHPRRRQLVSRFVSCRSTTVASRETSIDYSVLIRDTPAKNKYPEVHSAIIRTLWHILIGCKFPLAENNASVCHI